MGHRHITDLPHFKVDFDTVPCKPFALSNDDRTIKRSDRGSDMPSTFVAIGDPLAAGHVYYRKLKLIRCPVFVGVAPTPILKSFDQQTGWYQHGDTPYNSQTGWYQYGSTAVCNQETQEAVVTKEKKSKNLSSDGCSILLKVDTQQGRMILSSPLIQGGTSLPLVMAAEVEAYHLFVDLPCSEDQVAIVPLDCEDYVLLAKASEASVY